MIYAISALSIQRHIMFTQNILHNLNGVVGSRNDIKNSFFGSPNNFLVNS